MPDRGKYAAARNAGQGPVGYASSTQSRVRNIQNASPAYGPYRRNRRCIAASVTALRPARYM